MPTATEEDEAEPLSPQCARRLHSMCKREDCACICHGTAEDDEGEDD